LAPEGARRYDRARDGSESIEGGRKLMAEV
jgi:hypothetical protein